MSALQGVRGMPDLPPEKTRIFSAIEARLFPVLSRFRFEEVRLPLLESSAVFQRGVGAYTDIAQKEVYELTDKSGESLTLRPEGTAGFMRAALQHNWAKQQVLKAFYYGAMFRYERPQKGRQRQFTQLGIEYIGFQNPRFASMEVLTLSHCLLDALSLEGLCLELNTLGGLESRARYRAALQAFLRTNEKDLDKDSQSRIDQNPLRVWDSKVESTQTILEKAPRLMAYLSKEERDHFDALYRCAEGFKVKLVHNEKLVRGLDYYNDLVFEWTASDGLGAQSAVLGGGQYDALAGTLGANYPIPAAGFAAGIERLVMLVEAALPSWLKAPVAPDCFFVVDSEAALSLMAHLLEALTGAGYTCECPSALRSFKAQFKSANQKGARFALVVSEAQRAADTIRIQPLFTEEGTKEVPLQSFLAAPKQYLA